MIWDQEMHGKFDTFWNNWSIDFIAYVNGVADVYGEYFLKFPIGNCCSI